MTPAEHIQVIEDAARKVTQASIDSLGRHVGSSPQALAYRLTSARQQ